MSLTSLTGDEMEIVRKAIDASFEYFTFDYGTRIGVEPERAREILRDWPKLDDSNDDSEACLLINNSLNDLLHGEGISEAESRRLMGCDRAELHRVYRKWADSRGWKSTGIR